jgi:hypothetical protein
MKGIVSLEAPEKFVNLVLLTGIKHVVKSWKLDKFSNYMENEIFS